MPCDSRTFPILSPESWREYPARTSLVSPLRTSVVSRHARATLITSYQLWWQLWPLTFFTFFSPDTRPASVPVLSTMGQGKDYFDAIFGDLTHRKTIGPILKARTGPPSPTPISHDYTTATSRYKVLSQSQCLVLVNSENWNSLMGFIYSDVLVLKALWIVLSETIHILKTLHKTNILGMPPKSLP